VEDLAPKMIPNPEVKPSKSNRIYFIVGLVIVVAVLLTALIVYLYLHLVNNDKSNNPLTSVTPSASSSSAAVSDLSTYRNEDYGFQFDYPKTLDGMGEFRLYVIGPTSSAEKGDEVCLYFVPKGMEVSFASAANNRVCQIDLNKAVMMGGDTLNYQGPGRGTTFFDLTGFKDLAGKIALRVQSNPYGDYEALAADSRLDGLSTNKNGVKILSVKHSEDISPSTLLEPGKGNLGDYVNLSGNTLTALGIIYLGTNSYISESEFQGILDSFKVFGAKK
jgi:hypothetical protein